VHPPSRRLVLLAEKKGELVIWDPATQTETSRVRLDQTGLLGRAPASPNEGFEGLAFQEEDGRPGGGVFYLVHQRHPARLVELTFDPANPPPTLGAGAVLSRHALRPYEDLTAVTWSEHLRRLLVIAESADRLLIVSRGGGIDAVLALAGGQQEGLALDDAGTLWVADDRLGLLRFEAARPAIETALAAAGVTGAGS
jgi:uncharacterized protein YjiK